VTQLRKKMLEELQRRDLIIHSLPQESTFTSSAILPGTFGGHRIRSVRNTSVSISFICFTRSCPHTRSGSTQPRYVFSFSRLSTGAFLPTTSLSPSSAKDYLPYSAQRR